MIVDFFLDESVPQDIKDMGKKALQQAMQAQGRHSNNLR